MRRKQFSIITLIVAFLFSAWGNVIAAAFCPRYLSNRECCVKHKPVQVNEVGQKPACQHEMAEMEMGDMQMESEAASESADNSITENQPIKIATDSAADQVAIDLPVDVCAHCWMHSQPSSGNATVVAVDPSKRLVETNAPPADFVIALLCPFKVSITPVEHGPPGNSFPRHILINVFRI